MSNRTKKVKENIENDKKVKQYYMESTLAGSAICTIAKLVGLTEEQILKEFYELKDNFPAVKNVREMCDYLIDYFKMKESYKKGLVLVYDENNVFTPVVTVCIEASTGPVFLPISSSGLYPAIMRKIGEDHVKVEYIYDEDSDETETNNTNDKNVA